MIVNSEIPLTQEAREVGRIIRKEEPTGSPEKRTDGLQVKERQREGNQGKGNGRGRQGKGKGNQGKGIGRGREGKGNGRLRQGNGECAVMEVEESAQLKNYLPKSYPLETRVRGYESLRVQICVCTSVRSFYFHN